MRRWLAVVLVLSCAAARAEDTTICPECGELAEGEGECARDGEDRVAADLLVFHQTLAALARTEGGPWKKLAGEDGLPVARAVTRLFERYAAAAEKTPFAPWRRAAPPPAPSQKKACPQCFVEAPAGTECDECEVDLAPAELVHVHGVLTHLARLEPREGVKNPFARALGEDGTLDAAKLEALATAYSKKRSVLRQPATAFPITHPMSKRAHEVTPFLVFAAIKEAQEAAKKEKGEYAALESLIASGGVRGLSRAERAEYAFTGGPGAKNPAERWWALATPEGTCAGERFYFTNHTGKVWFSWRPVAVNDHTCAPPDGVTEIESAPEWHAPLGRTEEEREAVALAGLRRIVAAEVIHRRRTGHFGSLEALAKAKLLDAELASGKKLGYAFTVSRGEGRLAVVAKPEARGRSFHSNEKGEVLVARAPIELDEKTLRPRVLAEPWSAPPRHEPLAGIPYAAGAYGMLGTESLYEGRWLDAIEPLETAGRLDPRHATVWNNIGKTYLELDLLPWAQEGLEQALLAEQEKRSGWGHLAQNNLGLVKLKLSERTADPVKIAGHLAEARAHFEGAIAVDQRYTSAWVNLASTLIRQGDRCQGAERKALADRAVNVLEISGSLERGHHLIASSAVNLAYAHRLAGRHAAAVRALTLVPRIDASSVAIALGEVDAVLENLEALGEEADETREALRKLMAKFEAVAAESPETVRLWRAAGRIANLVAKDPKKAMKLYDKAIEAAPDEQKPGLEAEREALEPR